MELSNSSISFQLHVSQYVAYDMHDIVIVEIIFEDGPKFTNEAKYNKEKQSRNEPKKQWFRHWPEIIIKADWIGYFTVNIIQYNLYSYFYWQD